MGASMRVLQAVCGLLYIIATIAVLVGLVCLFAIRQPAIGFVCVGAAFGVLMVGLVIEGAWRIARDALASLDEQSAALRAIVGRRDKR